MTRPSTLLRILCAAGAGFLATASALGQAQYAGTYSGVGYTRVNVPGLPPFESSIGAWLIYVAADGTITSPNDISGTVSSTGAITFVTDDVLGLTTGQIADNQLTSDWGVLLGNGTTQFRLIGTGFTPAEGGGGGGGGGGVLVPPVITMDPITGIVPVGGTITLTASTSASNPTWQWKREGVNIPGATSATLTLTNIQKSQEGMYAVVLSSGGQTAETLAVVQVNETGNNTFVDFTAQPASQTAGLGGSVTFAVTINLPLGEGASYTYQWEHNGNAINGATNTSLTVSDIQPSQAGVYRLSVSNEGQVNYSDPAILGVLINEKVSGAGTEVGANIVHPNGNIYDQILLTGPAASFTADPGQVTRLSLIDMNDDIVQVEFSGAGTVTVTLEDPSGPAAPVKYNQPGVEYMKGHPSITIVGANETTYLSVFSVGSVTAVDQDLFPAGMTYDGVADLGLVAIDSTNNRFAGFLLANAGFFSTHGQTGLYAPGVEFDGPVYLHDITAEEDATPVLMTGAIGTGEVLITGGSLGQTNSRPLQVGLAQKIRMGAGTTSHGVSLTAQANASVVQRDGEDVTNEVIIPPGN